MIELWIHVTAPQTFNIESHFYYLIHFLINLGDCVWSEWLDTDCSVTCGKGTKTQRRFVRKPCEIENGGTCDGLNEKTEPCDTRIPCKYYGKNSSFSVHSKYCDISSIHTKEY